MSGLNQGKMQLSGRRVICVRGGREVFSGLDFEAVSGEAVAVVGRTPIEEMFSKVKEFLRRVAARVKGDLYDAVGEALRGVTDQDIIGWFQNAGLYAAHG